jgi:organic radical activating enzyme
MDQHGIYKFLNSKKGKIERVIISGGEPTIHNDLADVLKNKIIWFFQ